MPIYEYRCTECGHQAEHLQKISEPALTVCTVCGKPSFTKLVSAAGFQLKGSGWYATDFKGGAKKPEGKSEAKSDAKSDGKSDAKSDAKPESKPETKTESKATA
jgi:putative FmdB family regulatory protein